MGFLGSCCGCISLRRGSYLVGIYSIIYFSLFSYLSGPGVVYETIVRFDSEGWQSWLSNQTFNETEDDEDQTLLDDDEVVTDFGNPIVYVLSLVDFITEVLGVLSALLLIIGLMKDDCRFLVLFLIIVPLHTIIDTFMVIFIVLENINGDLWEVAMKNIPLLVLDLGLNSFNVYTVLCVLSQYQEYKMGRGSKAYQAYLKRQYSDASGYGITTNRSGMSTVPNRSSGKCEIWLEDFGLKKVPEIDVKSHNNSSEITKSLLKPHTSTIKNSPSLRSNRSSTGMEYSTIDTETAPELV